MTAPSPVEQAFVALRALNTSWNVEIGRPDGPGWIAGADLFDAWRGPFHHLLVRIAQRAHTEDRRTVAASFALRFGWASAMAIAPYLRHRCVPDIGLDNVSFKFKESTFFERTAIYRPRGTVVAGDSRAPHPSLTTVSDDARLIGTLRHALVSQAEPVVDALYEWSGFARKGTWGMLTSSWASQFIGLCTTPDDHRGVRPVIEAFFRGGDVVSATQPRMHAVTYGPATHLYQRRASCCRYYLLPQGDLCASCPLVSDEDRLARNREWMKTQLERQGKVGGHG
ncbi:MAG: (2Fe-2S)-binding protein [Vicinamibacteraceae bacterium]